MMPSEALGSYFLVGGLFSKDNHYTLFRYEDWPAWVLFTSVFVALISLDNFVMSRRPVPLTVGRAALYTLFWVACAAAFCGWVLYTRGPSQATMWMSGYMLEWMLSFDNLFVFHMIFSVYSTPDHLKHRPLYLGICGAIVFRLAFIFVGEYLMHAMFIMHFVFGLFLIYTGIKTATADEDDDDPTQHPVVQWLQKRVPFVSVYDSQGRFFVRCRVDAQGRLLPPAGAEADGGYGACGAAEAAPASSSSQAPPTGAPPTPAPVAASSSQETPRGRTQLRATMLFLVLICLEVSDLLFAVDSVSAIVAQVNDLFLAYTSAVFAMLGLRAMFFIIDELAKIFSLLKYGVAAVLTFIGVKLMLARVYHVPPGVVCSVLAGCIAASMAASVLREALLVRQEAALSDEVAKLGKILTPLQSPMPRCVKPSPV